MDSPRARVATLVVHGPLASYDSLPLCERASALLRPSRHGFCYCLLVDLDCDLASVDALARLALAAKRNDCEMCFLGASSMLCQLMNALGLSQLMRNNRGAEGD